ncbi:MAG: hypothetical protein RL318_1344 [Fibrobacterota bacterium]
MGRAILSIVASLACICCAQLPASRETSKSSADWVIDDCRVTYKGHLVPFGQGPREFVEIFGAASDSLIKPWTGHRPIRIYAWNRLGLNTEIWSDRHSDLFGGVTIYFRDHYDRSTKSTPERPSGRSSIEIKPYGLVDSNSVQSILSKGFHHSYALQGDEPSFLELDMDNGYWLSILPLRAMRGEFIGFSIHFMTPDSANVMTYPELLAQHGNACRSPGKGTPKHSTDTSRKRLIPPGLGALRNLKRIGVQRAGKTLKSLLPEDSGRSLMESAKDFAKFPRKEKP